jgi:Protein of unknown function (DUF998)
MLRRAQRRHNATAPLRSLGLSLLRAPARDGYRPLRHPVSSLTLGPGGWDQAANFAVTGTCPSAGG